MVRLRFAAAGPEAARATRRRLLPPPTRAHAPLYAETIFLSLAKSAINGASKNMLPHVQVENVREFLAKLTIEVQNRCARVKIILYLEYIFNVKKQGIHYSIHF